MGMGSDRIRPKHTSDHQVHFTGRYSKAENIRVDRALHVLYTYWHCEKCGWYLTENIERTDKLRFYTEAWISDLDIMCKGCTTGNKSLQPCPFVRASIDYESYETV